MASMGPTRDSWQGHPSRRGWRNGPTSCDARRENESCNEASRLGIDRHSMRDLALGPKLRAIEPLHPPLSNVQCPCATAEFSCRDTTLHDEPNVPRNWSTGAWTTPLDANGLSHAKLGFPAEVRRSTPRPHQGSTRGRILPDPRPNFSGLRRSSKRDESRGHPWIRPGLGCHRSTLSPQPPPRLSRLPTTSSSGPSSAARCR